VMMPPGTQSSPWLLSPLGRAWGVRSEWIIVGKRCFPSMTHVVQHNGHSHSPIAPSQHGSLVDVVGLAHGPCTAISWWRGLSPAIPMSKGFRSRKRIGDLANSTVIRQKQRDTRIYPGLAPSKGKRPTSCLSDFVLMVWLWWRSYNGGVDWI
jgi:hypothetical protein